MIEINADALFRRCRNSTMLGFYVMPYRGHWSAPLIARVLTATRTTPVMTIAKGVFIVTSLPRIYRPSFRVGKEPTLNVRNTFTN